MTNQETNIELLENLNRVVNNLGGKYRALKARKGNLSEIREAKKDFDFAKLALHNFRNIFNKTV